MSQELEETLCNLFMEIQKPYSKYCPRDRVNFLNYYYTLYKLCELLGEEIFTIFSNVKRSGEKSGTRCNMEINICRFRLGLYSNCIIIYYYNNILFIYRFLIYDLKCM